MLPALRLASIAARHFAQVFRQLAGNWFVLGGRESAVSRSNNVCGRRAHPLYGDDRRILRSSWRPANSLETPAGDFREVEEFASRLCGNKTFMKDSLRSSLLARCGLLGILGEFLAGYDEILNEPMPGRSFVGGVEIAIAHKR